LSYLLDARDEVPFSQILKQRPFIVDTDTPGEDFCLAVESEAVIHNISSSNKATERGIRDMIENGWAWISDGTGDCQYLSLQDEGDDMDHWMAKLQEEYEFID
jgi:hypothetical protein